MRAVEEAARLPRSSPTRPAAGRRPRPRRPPGGAAVSHGGAEPPPPPLFFFFSTRPGPFPTWSPTRPAAGRRQSRARRVRSSPTRPAVGRRPRPTRARSRTWSPTYPLVVRARTPRRTSGAAGRTRRPRPSGRTTLAERRARGELNPQVWPPVVDEERFDVDDGDDRPTPPTRARCPTA